MLWCLAGMTAAKWIFSTSGRCFVFTSMFVTMALAILVSVVGSHHFNIGPLKFQFCKTEVCNNLRVIYVAAFGATITYFLIALAIMVADSRNKKRIDQGFTWLKILVQIGLTIVGVYMGDAVYYVFFWLVILAPLFMFLQGVVAVDIVYGIRTRLVESESYKALLGLILLFIAIAATFQGLSFHYYYKGCSDDINGAIILVLVLSIILAAISMMPGSKHGLFPATVIIALCQLILFHSLDLHPDAATCAPKALKSTTWEIIRLVIILFLWLFTLLYGCYFMSGMTDDEDTSHTNSETANDDYNRSSFSSPHPQSHPRDNDHNLNPYSSVNHDDDIESIQHLPGTQAVTSIHPNLQKSPLYEGTFSPAAQVYLFALFAMAYIALLITHFGDHKQFHVLGIRGIYSMWAFVINIIIIALGYTWTVVAPICLTNREFD